MTNGNTAMVWAIQTSTLTVEAKIPVGTLPTAVAVSADGTTAYVTNGYGYSLSEIDTATDAVKNTMAKVGIYPFSVALYE